MTAAPGEAVSAAGSPYKAYKFKSKGKVYDRVRGPNGLDIYSGHADCAGCLAVYMNIAYREGIKSCSEKKRAAAR